jgi:dTMP kinase
MQGRFIVVEGLEGSGKSTAISTLKRLLTRYISTFITTREPGGTHVGEVIRDLVKNKIEAEAMEPRAELLLFYAARVQLIEQVIRPALQQGTWVLADRFELSSWAYQGGGRGLGEAILKQLSEFCVGDLQPDLTIFLDIPPEEGLLRVQKRGAMDRIEQEELSFFKTVSEAYRRALAKMDKVIFIDATLPLSVVRRKIRQGMMPLLDSGLVI